MLTCGKIENLFVVKSIEETYKYFKDDSRRYEEFNKLDSADQDAIIKYLKKSRIHSVVDEAIDLMIGIEITLGNAVNENLAYDIVIKY